MIDINKQIVTELNKTSNNVLYELAIQNPSLPLISYKIIDNSIATNADNLAYSNVIVQIKIYAKDLQTIYSYASEIDENLYNIGLRRTYCTELSEDDVIINVIQYSGLIREKYNQTGGNN